MTDGGDGPVGVLVNPVSGHGRAGRSATLLQDRLLAAGRAVQVLTGRDAGEALEVTRRAVDRGVAALVAVGGDGTAHLALQAVAGTYTPLAVLPAGTGNDLATCLGLATDPLLTAEAVLAGVAQGVDAVRTDSGRWWACVLGAGFDSAVNDRANRMTWPRGRRRYDLAVLLELGSFRPVPFALDLDGVRVETEAMLVAVGNAASYGAGMKVCPDADPTDGLLDVVVVGPLSRLGFLRLFPSVFRGQHVLHPSVTVYRARTVGLTAAGVTAYADGEVLQPLPVTCTVVPGALRMLGRPPRT